MPNPDPFCVGCGGSGRLPLLAGGTTECLCVEEPDDGRDPGEPVGDDWIEEAYTRASGGHYR